MSETGIGVPVGDRGGPRAMRHALIVVHQNSVISLLPRFVARACSRHVAFGRFYIPPLLLLFSCLPLVACAGGSHTEYAPSHPWIGKCATFTEPMAYLTNLPSDLFRDEAVRIGRSVVRLTEAEYLRKLPKGAGLIVTPVAPGMNFEVTAVFTIVHDGYSRMFVDDVEIAVLRDSNAQMSTSIVDELEPCP